MTFIEFINVVVAGVAAWMVGAVYYMMLAKPWMAAAAITEADVNNGDKTPFIISLVVMILASGTLRHVLHAAGIASIGGSIVLSVQLGLFIAGGWIFLNNAYEGKPIKLSVINAGYAVLACAVIGLVLALF